MSLPVRICHYPRRDGPLPADAKWVGRPGRFGNPHDFRELGNTEAVTRYRNDWHTGRARFTDADIRGLATYKALACACPLDQPCHVDVILELLDAEQVVAALRTIARMVGYPIPDGLGEQLGEHKVHALGELLAALEAQLEAHDLALLRGWPS